MHWFLMAAALADPSAEAMDAVVLVVQGSSTCSGALVDAKGTVATAYHCVASGGRPRITTRSGQVVVGRVRAVDVRRDLAVIDAPELSGGSWLAVRSEPPDLGETVSALGHPYGVVAPMGFLEGTLRWSLTRGVVSAVGPHAVQFSAPINPGNSGGPVVDEQGNLVAVVSRRTGGSEGLGFGGRADQLAELMQVDAEAMGVGGTWSLQPVLTSWQGGDGAISVGGRMVFAIRDRFVFGMTLRGGLAPRLGAIQFDSVRSVGPAARVGLRQRLGRGRMAVRLDAWGEASTVTGYDAVIVAEDIDVRAAPLGWVPLVGGQIGLGGAAFDLGCSVTGEGCATSLVLNWPGVVGVF